MLITFLAFVGIVLSTITLAIHYSAAQPHDPKSNWDSAYVSQSSYSVIAGIPVAASGIVGYASVGLLAFFRRRILTVIFSLFGLAYALYLTNVEAHILNVWCVYCLCSLIVMSLITLLAFGQLIFGEGQPAQAISR